MAEEEQQVGAPQAQDVGPRCPSCAAPARRLTSILDVKNNRSIQIFRCDSCRKEVWED
jgi:transposase-like protein